MSRMLTAWAFVIALVLTVVACSDESLAPLAVYLTPEGGGSLSASDLAEHPEVVVVHDQRQLEEAVAASTSIWVDRDMLASVDVAWLSQRAKRRCPIALIGFNDATYAFRERLQVVPMIGPYIDWSERDLKPGFSVLQTTGAAESSIGYLKGFKTMPTVESVAAITTPLLTSPSP